MMIQEICGFGKSGRAPAPAEEAGALAGGDPDQPDDIWRRAAIRADALQGGHERLGGQIFRIFDVPRVRQVIAIDAQDVATIELGKSLGIRAGLLRQAGIIQ